LVPGLPTLFRLIIEASTALLEGDRDRARTIGDPLIDKWPLRDPCATYYLARTLSAAGHPRTLEILRRSVEGGFHPYAMFMRTRGWIRCAQSRSSRI